jgi:hypothetical protein
MSNISRRNLLRSGVSGATAVGLLSGFKAEALDASSAACRVGFDFQTYTINGISVARIASTAADMHSVKVSLWRTEAFKNYDNVREERFLLSVDVGLNPDLGLFHPTQDSSSGALDTITDIYVFNQANNELLFWKKLGSGELAPATMFSISAAMKNLGLKITVVARCSMHGYSGVNFDMAAAPKDYANSILNNNDPNKICGGCTIRRPYVSYLATGSQGDLGVLHRPVINKISNSEVRVHLGGAADGTGRHPKFSDAHFVFGGSLWDQNGNELSNSQVVVFSNADTHQMIFKGMDLAGAGVKTLRALVYDTLQGRFMGFLDI